MTTYLGAKHWKPGVLQDLVFLQRGFDITKAQQIAGNVPVYSSSGLSSWHNEEKAPGPGIIIGRKGTLGSLRYSENDYWPPDTTLWSKSLRGNNPRYIYYALKCLGLEQFNVGGANPTLNRNHIHDLPIYIPEPSLQNDIASILFAYDDLIENNQRRIALLEEAARLLYREWFVHFRFPGHERIGIVDGIPDGWDQRTLGDVVEVVKNTVKPSDFTDDDIHIGLQHIPRRSFTLAGWEAAKDLGSGKTRFEEGDILFCKIRPYFHKVGLTLRAGLASSDALALRVKDMKDWPLVVCATSSDHFVAVASKTVREGSKMPRADWKVLQKYSIPKPPEELLGTFNDTVGPITAQCKALALQIRALSQARDLLLPPLMSGEIAV